MSGALTTRQAAVKIFREEPRARCVDVAKRLGVSKQRIEQIARIEGITLRGECVVCGLSSMSRGQAICGPCEAKMRNGVSVWRHRNKGRVCSVDDCSKPAKALGMCESHYQRHIYGRKDRRQRHHACPSMLKGKVKDPDKQREYTRRCEARRKTLGLKPGEPIPAHLRLTRVFDGQSAEPQG